MGGGGGGCVLGVESEDTSDIAGAVGEGGGFDRQLTADSGLWLQWSDVWLVAIGG